MNLCHSAVERTSYILAENNTSVRKRLTDDDAVMITLVLTGKEVADEIDNLSSHLVLS